MQARDVLELYAALDKAGVAVWIDGGWAVDAVVGRVTRPHGDLDIAIEMRSLEGMRRVLAERGFRPAPRADETEWNFVLADAAGRSIDVHVVRFDMQDGVNGPPLEGIAYPAGSLAGEGRIEGVAVRCVRADVQLQFKLGYPPRTVDRSDVTALCALLGRSVPDTHRPD